MQAIKLQHSKDLFCDFLLAKMWQGWLKKNNFDTDRDYDLISNRDHISQFYQDLINKLTINQNEFEQFSIKSVDDLQKQLRQSYYNLMDNDIDYQKGF